MKKQIVAPKSPAHPGQRRVPASPSEQDLSNKTGLNLEAAVPTTFESLLLAEEVVYKLLGRTMDLGYSREIDSGLEGFSVDCCMKKVRQVAHLGEGVHDLGEWDPSMQSEGWKCSEEPVGGANVCIDDLRF
jgi:hypothetical protein